MQQVDLPRSGETQAFVGHGEGALSVPVCPRCRLALQPTETVCPRDGGTAEVVSFEPLSPEITDRFQALRPFAKGNSGSLYLAEEILSGRVGVLKVLHGRLVANAAERQRLKRELSKQSTLTNPHLLLPIASGEGGSTLWLLREWLDAESLCVRLSREKRLPMLEALVVTAQLATALDELHRAGLLHRDLKPGHVLLQPQPSGFAKALLIDAGVVALLDSSGGFDVMGTPGYIAPEQATGKLVSFRSDLYALGCVMYEMLTGTPLFQGEETKDLLHAHAEQVPPEPPSELPQELQDLLWQLLAKDPRERPFSAQQVRRAIEPFIPEAAAAFLAMPLDAPRGTLLGMPKPPMAPGTRPPPPPPEMGSTMPPPPPEAAMRPTTSVPPPTPEAAMRPTTSVPPPVAVSSESTHELDALDIEEVEVAVLGAPDGETLPERDMLSEPTPAEELLDQAAQRLAEPSFEAMSEPPPAEASTATTGNDAAEMDAAASAADPIHVSFAAAGHAVETEYDDMAETAATLHDEVHPFEDARSVALAQEPRGEVIREEAISFDLEKRSASSIPPTLGFDVSASAPLPPTMAWDARTDPATMPPGSIHPPAADPWINESYEEALPKKSRTGIALVSVLVLGCLASSAAGWFAYSYLGPLVAGRSGELSGPRIVEATPGPVEPPREAKTAEPIEARVAVPAPEEAAPVEAAPVEAAPVEAAPVEAAPVEAAPATPGDNRSARRARARAERPARVEPSPARAQSGTSFADLRTAARDHFRARRYREAAQAYERAAAINPSHPGVFAGLGAARSAAGDHRGAVLAYQRAVRLQPSSSGFAAALGRAYRASGDLASARQAYERALSLDPSNNAARQGLQAL